MTKEEYERKYAELKEEYRGKARDYLSEKGNTRFDEEYKKIQQEWADKSNKMSLEYFIVED